MVNRTCLLLPVSYTHLTHPDITWFDEILNKNATTQAYNLNVTGGNKVTQYFVSIGYQGEKDVSYTHLDVYKRQFVLFI